RPLGAGVGSSPASEHAFATTGLPPAARPLGHHTCSPLGMGAERVLVEHEIGRGRPPAFPRHYEPRLQEPERHTDSWVKSGYLVDTSDESTKISVTVKS